MNYIVKTVTGVRPYFASSNQPEVNENLVLHSHPDIREYRQCISIIVRLTCQKYNKQIVQNFFLICKAFVIHLLQRSWRNKLVFYTSFIIYKYKKSFCGLAKCRFLSATAIQLFKININVKDSLLCNFTLNELSNCIGVSFLHPVMKWNTFKSLGEVFNIPRFFFVSMSETHLMKNFVKRLNFVQIYLKYTYMKVSIMLQFLKRGLIQLIQIMKIILNIMILGQLLQSGNNE